MLQVILLPFIALSVGLSAPVSHLEVIQADNSQLQPYVSTHFEDELTATHIAQPVDYNNQQVTLHGGLIQNAPLNILTNNGTELLFGHGLRELHYEY